MNTFIFYVHKYIFMQQKVTILYIEAGLLNAHHLTSISNWPVSRNNYLLK